MNTFIVVLGIKVATSMLLEGEKPRAFAIDLTTLQYERIDAGG